jgi:hypothetical protein
LADLRRVWLIGLVLLALTPSVWLAWTWRAMPHLGFYHDDSIYWVSAKSLAANGEYRIASLPNQPYQTKYPPLYPALLALVWKGNSSFPANLPAAMLLAWCVLPIYILLIAQFLKRYAFSLVERAVLCAIAALNPIAMVFSASLMPDLLFTALLLASLLLAELATADRSPLWMAAAAGGVCGLAYLTRSAALPVLVTAPLCFVLRKQFRQGLLCLVAMLPAVIGWQLWVRAHVSDSPDLVTLYYTNYFGFQLFNVQLADLPMLVWRNLDGLLMGIGRALTFDVEYGSKHLERVVAIAAIAGCARLARRTGKVQFPVAAIGFCLLLLVWHYQPDQRFVFPLYPLLLAGLWTEIRNISKALQVSWAKPAVADRIAAGVAGAALTGFCMFVIFTTISGDLVFLPRLFASYRADLEKRRPAYEWIANHAPAEANVFAYDDPLVYLYTGRKSCGLPIPPKLYLHNDDAGIERLLYSIPDFARQNRLDYLLLTHDDFYRDLHSPGAEHLARAVETNSLFRRLYQTGAATVYRYAP